jgi:hypothetical protein
MNLEHSGVTLWVQVDFRPMTIARSQIVDGHQQVGDILELQPLPNSPQ